MPATLQLGSKGPDVTLLQQLLVAKNYLAPDAVDGDFGPRTLDAVRAFQARSCDQNGLPLKVDGVVGPVSWWSLNNEPPTVVPTGPVNFSIMPPTELGGSATGRAALQVAINEMNAGAREIGGNNMGPFVTKYLHPAGLPAGDSWCASFVSWCFLQAAGGDKTKMAFAYCPLARKLLHEFDGKGWGHEPPAEYEPQPGDLVFWWREALNSPLGHVGFVHSLQNGTLYTIEGNRSPRVQGFSYPFGDMKQVLGYGHCE